MSGGGNRFYSDFEFIIHMHLSLVFSMCVNLAGRTSCGGVISREFHEFSTTSFVGGKKIPGDFLQTATWKMPNQFPKQCSWNQIKIQLDFYTYTNIFKNLNRGSPTWPRWTSRGSMKFFYIRGSQSFTFYGPLWKLLELHGPLVKKIYLLEREESYDFLTVEEFKVRNC